MTLKMDVGLVEMDGHSTTYLMMLGRHLGKSSETKYIRSTMRIMIWIYKMWTSCLSAQVE